MVVFKPPVYYDLANLVKQRGAPYLPSATKLRRLCFYMSLSVILFTGGGVQSQHALQVVSQHALQKEGCLLLGGAYSRGGVPAPMAVSAPSGVPAPGGPAPRGSALEIAFSQGGACSQGGTCSQGGV